MTSSLDRRLDGTLALFIDGDLKFTRTDGRIYGKSLLERAEDKEVIDRAREETRIMLLADREEAEAYQSQLCEELEAYQLTESDEVHHGVHLVSRSEAIQRTQQSLWKANLKLQTIDAQLARFKMPAIPVFDTTQES